MTDPQIERPAKHRRSRRGLAIVATIGLAGAVGFAGLGTWQLERLAWKTGLIAAVEARSTATPTDPSTGETWTGFDPDQDEYRHVAVTGQFHNSAETFVQAVTVYGGGFWVMTPLELDDGRSILVNRGFVPPDRRALDARGSNAPEDAVVASGLLRQSEPDGGFLRENDPAGDRWFSRDVAAIAAKRGLRDTAPFFIDADATPPGTYPIGGLTVLSFSNNHLIYALTWFGLSAMLLAGVGFVVWDRRRGTAKLSARE